MPRHAHGPVLLHGGAEVLVDPRGPHAVGGLLVRARVCLEEPAGDGAVGELHKAPAEGGTGWPGRAARARGLAPTAQVPSPRTFT